MDVTNQIIAAINEENTELAVELANSGFFTPMALFHVADKCQFETMWQLCRIGMENHVDLHHFITWEFYMGRTDVVDYLFADGRMDPNYRFGFCYPTIFMLACSLNNGRDIVERLLALGADPQVTDFRGRNSFFYALESRDVNIFRLLFFHTRQIDFVDDLGKTLLHHACSATVGSPEIFDELLNLGILDINAQDINGDTPLNWAIHSFRNEDDLLIHRSLRLINHPDIDLKIKNRDEETVWDLCSNLREGKDKGLIQAALRAAHEAKGLPVS